METIPTLRPALEVQRAHDLLVALIFDSDLWPGIETERQLEILSCLNVLCWCLGHRHNMTFGSNLLLIEEILNSAGIEIVDLGRLDVPGDPPEGGAA
jgi:hypothetical protein